MRLPDVVVRGWNFDGLGLQKQNKDGDWVEVMPFMVLPLERYVDEDGETRGFLVRVIRRDSTRELVIPSRVLRAGRPADVIAEAGGPDLQLGWSKTIVQLLSDVMAGEGVGVETKVVITRASWRGGELLVPGASGLAPPWDPALRVYGDRAALPEEAARQAWTQIVEEAVEHPKLVMVLGMPFGSMYAEPLELDAFALHLTGESHSGKTESAELAMSTMGWAQRGRGPLYRTWNMSEQAPTNLLKHVGILPVWFDEAAVSDRDPDQFTRMLFSISQGMSRAVADTEGGLRSGSDERWFSSVISTGEQRLSTQSGLTGLRRRVLEVYAPLLSSRRGEDLHDELMRLARTAYGWPVYWLVQDPGLDLARELHLKVFMALADVAEGQQVEIAQASAVATCVMGFAQLARAVGVEVSYTQLVAAGKRVFRKLVAAGAEEGADVGERGLRALKEAIQSTDRFPTPDDDLYRERWGVLFPDGYCGILGEATLARILREYAGLRDPQPVLEKWSEQGRLHHDRGSYTGRRRIYVPGRGKGTQSRLYLVRLS